jgi:uncharacterized protein (TIGR02001 family)
MEKTMNIKSKLVLALLATSSAAFAQTAPAAPEVTYNVGVVSQYRYRGIAQTHGDPALQGGVDYANAKGFYAGAWGSTIKFIEDASPANKGKVELDLYAGYKFEAAGLTYDVGYLRYEYVNNNVSPNVNTNEVYGAVTAGVFTAKYSHSLSNLFGAVDSKGSKYLDLSANFDLGNGYSFVPHVGRQVVNNDALDANYTDYALTLTKDFGNGLAGSLSAITTNAKGDAGQFYRNPQGYDMGKNTVVAGVKYSF